MTFLKNWGRRVKRAIPRRLPERLRLLPNFIIIGAQRGGTTSLYEYLAQHPFVRPALQKELHFFDVKHAQGLLAYRRHFPTRFQLVRHHLVLGRAFLTGEASPYYIYHPHVPQRVSAALPRVKLIALLRNPVDRAYSHYKHMRRVGHETLSFAEAIAAEEERLGPELRRMRADPDYRSVVHQAFSYLDRGLYVEQLQRWRRFFPEEQMLVLKSEDMFDDPQSVYGQTLEFLELPPWQPASYRSHNRIASPEMEPATRARLIEYFKPHNQRLYEYLGRDLGWDD